MSQHQGVKIIVPNREEKVLLHSCCAVCSGAIVEMMVGADIECTLFFYNPNIHPTEEYQRRREENIILTKRMEINFVEGSYEEDLWFERVKGLEKEAERGKRCSVCFDMRMERTALYAHEHGFKVFTSSLGISRWKDMAQVNESGIKAAARYPELVYWSVNWRKKGGSQRMYEIAKTEGLYRQDYCGCSYSLKNKT